MKPASDLVMLAELARHFPKGFLKTVSAGIRRSYPQAWDEVANNPLYRDDDIKESVYPIVRRGIIETTVRTAAAQFDLSFDVHALSESKANSYTRVRAGRFVLTCHHIASFMPLPRYAVYRKNNAAVNFYLEQGQLDLGDILSEDKESDIYVYCLHTTNSANKFTCGDIVVKAPGSDRAGVICSYDISEVMEAQAAPMFSRASNDDLLIIPKSIRKAQ